MCLKSYPSTAVSRSGRCPLKSIAVREREYLDGWDGEDGKCGMCTDRARLARDVNPLPAVEFCSPASSRLRKEN